MWKTSELKALPDFCQGALARVIEISVNSLSWPHQFHLFLNPCLGKKEGLRTIGLSPIIYSVWDRDQQETKNWELANTAEYDTCKSGSSALFAAIVRNVDAEIANWLDMHAGSILNDFKKFFDSMNINILLTEAIHTRYPPVEMCMAIQQHMAPRAIKIQQFVSRPIEIYNSIIAGCLQSIPMTRVYFLRGMPEVNKSGPKEEEVVGKSRLYVDDCAQRQETTKSRGFTTSSATRLPNSTNLGSGLNLGYRIKE